MPQILIDVDREALARYDLAPADLARSVEGLFQGTTAGEIVQGGLPHGSRCLPERLRGRTASASTRSP